MNYYGGIDVSLEASHLCGVDSEGQVVRVVKMFPLGPSDRIMAAPLASKGGATPDRSLYPMPGPDHQELDTPGPITEARAMTKG